uniref:Reverse transcriptase domain-containing protein n=1 Tax=Oreochromis niloticus TaxID=8128 RepID=A0A669D202_ORENI
MGKFNVVDIWREKYPDDRLFTWSNKTGSRQSRIDFWLVSDCIDKENITVNILATPLTDHRAIHIDVQMFTLDNIPHKFSYWKLNNSLLKDKMVNMQINKLIVYYWNKANREKSFCTNWELFKFEACKFLRRYGSQIAKLRKAEEQEVISRIASYYQRSPEEISEEDKLTLLELQNKLDGLYRRKAEGAFVRSRKRWLEEGEQNSAYFFRLEKYRSKTNSIHQLNINGIVSDNPREISHFCAEFYSKLYNSKYNDVVSTRFFNNIKNLKTIVVEDKSYCDSPLTVEEVCNSISALKANKSPGTDGLTAEFYKSFSYLLAPFLLQVFTESIENNTLPPTLTQGLLTLIPKPNKDLLFIDNWRPISLLNNDYKIMALILANRIKEVLDTIIDETQSGFMRNRHISNNIRLVLDLLDYSDLVPDNSFILFLDFYKAFDTIEHQFIFHSLEKFGFGEFFCKAVKTLYTNGNSSIKMINGSTPRFDLKRGIRQGCPISPYLFLLCTQILATNISNSVVQGITIADKELVISQLADDTTLFLKNANQIPPALSVIRDFSEASGLCLNLKKCELLPIKDCPANTICNISVKQEVTYLGLLISKDQKSRCSSNFTPIIQKTLKKFNQWLQRDLSLKGRVLITKAEGISRLTYAALSLHLDKKISKDIDRMLFNFIWKNRTHYIRKTVVMNKYESGGLNVLDFSTLNNTFKINWAKHFLKNPTSIWNFIPYHVFSRFGGFNFILNCNYNVEKLPVKLSSFHKQVLLAWTLIYKHNFSPHKYLIWNNRDILFKNKSLFLETWVQNGILLVAQLVNKEGQLLTYNDFIALYNFPISVQEFSMVLGAIPSGTLMLYKNTDSSISTSVTLPGPAESPIGKICFSQELGNSNKRIRSLFQEDVVSLPYVISYWNRYVPDIKWKTVWMIPHKYLIVNKVKEVSFKILHKCYPASHYMVKFKRDINTNCTFCGDHPETVTHLFWYCSFTQRFWKEFSRFVVVHILREFSLRWENVLFCFFKFPKKNDKCFFMINLLILLAKFFIHKCKFTNKTPFFCHFFKDVEMYIQSISDSTNKKALKTIYICEFLRVFL